MNKKKVFVICIAAAVLIAAVIGFKLHSNQNKNLQSEESFLSGDPFETSGSLANGLSGSNYVSAQVVSPNAESMLLTYAGEPITVTYEFYSEHPCNMGLMIFVNGKLQPYTVSGKDKETTMYTVDLKENETKQFSFEFVPVCGEQGDELPLVFANVYNPEVIEFNTDVNTFGNNQKISQPLPWTLKFEESVPNTKTQISVNYKIKEFSVEDKNNFISQNSNGTVFNKLDNRCFAEIRKNSSEIITSISTNDLSENKYQIYMYGNLTGKYYLSLYGDFQQIPLNGSDYIQVEVKRDDYSVVDIDFSQTDISKYKNVFAVLAPAEFDSELAKTQSIYISQN